MRLLLDTTYVLPAIGVAIKGLPTDLPVRLMEQGHEISISDITLFELAAKGAKYVTGGELEAKRVSRGIKAIIYDEKILKVPNYDSSVLHTAFTLRRTLNDFIDCLILSSAVNKCDILLTEDDRIHDLAERTFLREITQTVNPEFKIHKISGLL
jgi:predicted nucleic acid-binding protein